MPYIPKKLFEELLRSGSMCSNVCYNIAQQRAVQPTWPVEKSYKSWDASKEAIRQYWAKDKVDRKQEEPQ